MRALIIETSTERGLIALTENEQVITSTELPIGLNQSKHLMPELQKLFVTHSIIAGSIDCIGVGVGPGSYTGIRIGVSVAKAFAYAWGIPLIDFSSLCAFVPQEREMAFATLIDAKMGGAYILKASINADGTMHSILPPQVCALEQLNEQLSDIYLIVSPTIKILKSKVDEMYPNSQWQWQETPPSSSTLAKIVHAKYQSKEWNREGHLKLLYLRKTQAELEKEKENF